MKSEIFHGFMQLFEMSAGDGDNRMRIVEIEFGSRLVYLDVEQPRVGNEAATGGKVERDAEARSHHFGIETTIFDGRSALKFG